MTACDRCDHKMRPRLPQRLFRELRIPDGRLKSDDKESRRPEAHGDRLEYLGSLSAAESAGKPALPIA
jgi:hypothetical protein